ncbi:hypothetical protein B0H19DRAFT_1262015 [Mycena capillaripes]|nr:hypothetical protein B0H19DRAFT_1277514 [Mycena capillaripes]KAJ6555877.1 hypothetical protein B0H19DRAFT_1262015 [Mycena capillaripes]
MPQSSCVLPTTGAEPVSGNLSGARSRGGSFSIVSDQCTAALHMRDRSENDERSVVTLPQLALEFRRQRGEDGAGGEKGEERMRAFDTGILVRVLRSLRGKKKLRGGHARDVRLRIPYPLHRRPESRLRKKSMCTAGLRDDARGVDRDRAQLNEVGARSGERALSSTLGGLIILTE